MIGLGIAVKAQTLVGGVLPDACPAKWNDSNGDCIADIGGAAPGAVLRVLLIGAAGAAASFAAWKAQKNKQ